MTNRFIVTIEIDTDNYTDSFKLDREIAKILEENSTLIGAFNILEIEKGEDTY